MENSTKPTYYYIFQARSQSYVETANMGHAIHKCLFENIMSRGHRPQCYVILQPLTITDMRKQQERSICVSSELVGLDRPHQHHGQRRVPESSIQRTSSMKSP